MQAGVLQRPLEAFSPCIQSSTTIACKIKTNFDPFPHSRPPARHHHLGPSHSGLPPRPRRRCLLPGRHQAQRQSHSLPARRRFLPPPVPSHHLRQTNCRIDPRNSPPAESDNLPLAVCIDVSDPRSLPANCPSL